MKRLDKKVNKIKYTQKVLVYQEEKKSTDHNIEYSSDYESSKSYWDPFISCGKDDLKNLLMAFEVRQVNPLCKVYSVCNDINNIRIYANKGIEIIENFEQFERIVEHVKETNQISV